MKTRELAIAAAAMLCVSAAPAMTAPSVDPLEEMGLGRSTHIHLGMSVPIPQGYYELCVAQPSVCRPRKGQADVTRDGQVVLSRKRLQQMVSVNAAVNRSMRAVEDINRLGVADKWSIGGSSGDCEDFALTKRQRLLAQGWPSSALLIALVRTSWGQQHAVLLVRTDKGDYALDNLVQEVKPWRSTSYSWDKVQSPTQMWVWHNV